MKKALATARSNKGFTLIELMIVVGIIGILAAIAIPQFSEYRERAYAASMKADCHSICLAEEAYFVDNNAYLATATPATCLAGYGVRTFSNGNSGTVTCNDANVDFTVTVSSSKTGSVVTFHSTTGQTTIGTS